jgi:hypothetical protein
VSVASAPQDGEEILMWLLIPDHKDGGQWVIGFSLRAYPGAGENWRVGTCDYKDEDFGGWELLPAPLTPGDLAWDSTLKVLSDKIDDGSFSVDDTYEL